jgi:hypothetical protein
VELEDKEKLIQDHNKRVARENSWVHALFEKAGLSFKQKQDVWNLLRQDQSLKQKIGK